MSTVYLIEATSSEDEGALKTKVETLWHEAGLGRVFAANDLTAVKVHVGEPGTTTFTPPAVVQALVAEVAHTGASPFLTDTAVLYRSPRDNGIGHARVAMEHGFGAEIMGAPFLPADGLDGSDAVEVEVNGTHFREVSIASAILHARSLLVVSHATGHLGTGFGGALKNLGMGCCSKKAKLRQHHGQKPRIDENSCHGCAVCAEWCPSDAITVEQTALIDHGLCIGCGECIAVCREGAVSFDWRIMGRQLQERIVEHAAAVVRAKREHIAFVTVAQKITKNCDCLGVSEQPVVEDIGLLASFDPVAIDQAVLQLVRERAGCELSELTYPQHDASLQINYAEAMGLGSSEVDLVTVG